MGANAQTTVPTFTAGQVLTAAEMNNSARTGVPVFADTTARDAAFGGSGEKTLAEGQLCYVENLTGDAQIQYYDGSTWNSLGAPGLTLISSTTIGTAVASVTVSSAFSSTYDNYRIVVIGGVASTAAALNITLGAANSAYYWAGMFSRFDNGGTGAVAGNNTTSWRVGVAQTANISATFDVMSPNLAKTTTFSGFWTNIDGAAGENAAWVGGFQNSTTQFTEFTLAPSTGTLTGGTIRVYGYRN